MGHMSAYNIKQRTLKKKNFFFVQLQIASEVSFMLVKDKSQAMTSEFH